MAISHTSSRKALFLTALVSAAVSCARTTDADKMHHTSDHSSAQLAAEKSVSIDSPCTVKNSTPLPTMEASSTQVQNISTSTQTQNTSESSNQIMPKTTDQSTSPLFLAAPPTKPYCIAEKDDTVTNGTIDITACKITVNKCVDPRKALAKSTTTSSKKIEGESERIPNEVVCSCQCTELPFIIALPGFEVIENGFLIRFGEGAKRTIVPEGMEDAFKAVIAQLAITIEKLMELEEQKMNDCSTEFNEKYEATYRSIVDGFISFAKSVLIDSDDMDIFVGYIRGLYDRRDLESVKKELNRLGIKFPLPQSQRHLMKTLSIIRAGVVDVSLENQYIW